jgi:hypothetical protein
MKHVRKKCGWEEFRTDGKAFGMPPNIKDTGRPGCGCGSLPHASGRFHPYHEGVKPLGQQDRESTRARSHVENAVCVCQMRLERSTPDGLRLD